MKKALLAAMFFLGGGNFAFGTSQEIPTMLLSHG